MRKWICPNCYKEFDASEEEKEGEVMCPSCDVDLVEGRPINLTKKQVEMILCSISVAEGEGFSDDDEDGEIPCLVKQLKDLWGIE